MTNSDTSGDGKNRQDTQADPPGYINPLEKDPRPDWDRYFMDIARLVSSRSTCLARQVGAVLVREKRIVSTGYNGSPAGLPHCIDLGCLRRGLGVPSGERMELCRGSCAEENAIVQAARLGQSVVDGWMYTTYQPCLKCARMIINAGLKGVTFAGEYPSPMTREFLQAAKVELIQFDIESGRLEQAAKVATRYLSRDAHRTLRASGENRVSGDIAADE
jgi:dCMP deaminase